MHSLAKGVELILHCLNWDGWDAWDGWDTLPPIPLIP